MNLKSLVIATALVGGLLSSPARAFTTRAHGQGDPDLRPPVPAKVVRPTGLPGELKGAKVTLRLTVDAAGQPHDITILTGDTPRLRRTLVSAVSQWQFIPASRHGVPVATTVVLPLRLEDSGS